MNLEIERKFLVNDMSFIAQAASHNRIVQAYLNSDKSRTVRVRISGDMAFLTIKGKSNDSGLSRFEWEQAIAQTDAEQLLTLCEPGRIDKVRYLVPVGKHTYEVDVFAGDNQGLVLAEVELLDEQELFEKPSWLGAEVTGNRQYYNSMLSKNPFINWP
ncbi:CYTH domain-containing protein [Agarivorans sp. MS3-6]|uniref:CYTH domain-containing protein n=1 Tax=Agarivorans sp. TSD2052 TaxID=2937286 RepID=UPI00200FCC98|nr:CYTH domain-containing protein [Agarivorans sp. TSD2052]UPW18609.1 CYTH domain-containing protein [Agarivorans sp. TSD2052]